jgi:hypothetical protein
VVELQTVVASKSLYVADRVFFSSASSFHIGFSIVKMGLIFTFVVSCTSDQQFQLRWPRLPN